MNYIIKITKNYKSIVNDKIIDQLDKEYEVN